MADVNLDKRVFNTDDENDFLRENTKGLSILIEKIFMRAIFLAFQNNIKDYLIESTYKQENKPFIIDRLKIVSILSEKDKKEIRKKFPIIDNNNSLKNMNNNDFKSIIRNYNGFNEDNFNTLLNNLDYQALIKSIRYSEGNFNRFKEFFNLNKNYKSILNNLINLRNSKIGHETNMTYRDMTPKMFKEEVLDVFLSGVKPLSEYFDDKIELLYKRFQFVSDQVYKEIGYPPIYITELSEKYDIPRDELIQTLLEKGIEVKSESILGHSEEDVLCIILNEGVLKPITDKYHGSSTVKDFAENNIENDDESLNKLTTLKYLSQYKINQNLSAQQLEEIVKNYNIFVDKSFLMAPYGRYFLSYILMPYLKRYKTKIFIERSVRTEIYETEILNRSLLKNTIYDVDEVDKSAIESEKNNATQARIVLNQLKKSKCIFYRGTANTFTSSKKMIIETLEKYKDHRMCILTLDRSMSSSILKLGHNMLSLRSIPKDKIRLWNDYIPNINNSFQPKDDGPKKIINTEETKKSEKSIRKEQQTQANKIPESGDQVFSHKKIYTLDKELGRGGEGVVYSVKENSHLAIKIYFKNRATSQRENKLSIMVKKKIQERNVCWPQEIIKDENNQFVGYSMRLIPQGYKELETTVFKLGSKTIRERLMPNWGRKELVKVCLNVSQTVNKLHQQNILIGDVNGRNILVNLKNADVMFVDCDSYQIENYPCPVYTPVFTSPKLINRNGGKDNLNFEKIIRTVEDEEYAISSLIFHILMLGKAPYEAKDNSNDFTEALMNYTFEYKIKNKDSTGSPDGPYLMIWNNLLKVVKEAFIEVFSNRNNVTTEKWIRIMKEYQYRINQNQFTNDLLPIKYYIAPGQENEFQDYTCELCKREANIDKRVYYRKVKRNERMLCNQCASALALATKYNRQLR